MFLDRIKILLFHFLKRIGQHFFTNSNAHYRDPILNRFLLLKKGLDFKTLLKISRYGLSFSGNRI
ncbi:hypothetical protein CH373_02070 [Leptospira perolatii]|uniref:Uncharacterized protein n=1 Tax=Leptospira perolatii TaxID=2023191 RepID=A0A2M9ZRY0_9LEPT|nr:hypothetical protein CH360_02070 [Leptospira perolatii]PJZ74847.1 hypothetical protein CH373_02070 [Leptospira perolatii]